jgi:dynein assembly factor 3
VTEDDRCSSALKTLVNFDSLRFKERDGVEEVISSWYSCHQFDIEKSWDQRLRYHYKDRYDVRKNMVDWDFNMYLKKLMPHVNDRQYK